MAHNFLSFPCRREYSQIIKMGVAMLLALNIQACSGKPSAATMQLLQDSRNNMVYVQGGTFTMGQVIYNGQPTQAYTPHQVTLSSFYISKDNINFGDYDAYTEAIGKPYIENDARENKAFFRAAQYPVDGATWYQAHDYCAWLAKETGLPYALPTEAQWEYAARNRGNPNWAFPTNNGKQELGINFPGLDQVTSQQGNITGGPSALPVGSLPCTPMGICGLTGEVNQWVNDWNQQDYGSNAVTNPQGPATGTQRVMRGGGAGASADFVNTISRDGVDPNSANGGFRCVINSITPSDQLGAFASGYPK